MKIPILLLGLGCLVISLLGCTARGGEGAGVASTVTPAGFWQGLWHGCIAPITFIVSLFDKTVGVYEVHNDGVAYNFGFAFGLIVALGGGRGAGRKAWKKKHDKTLSTRKDENEG